MNTPGLCPVLVGNQAPSSPEAAHRHPKDQREDKARALPAAARRKPPVQGIRDPPPAPEAEQPEPPGLHADSSVCQRPVLRGLLWEGRNWQSRNDAEPLAAGPAVRRASSHRKANLPRAHLGEASVSPKHPSHPGPSQERGGQSCSPEPLKLRFHPARGHFCALLTGFFGAVVSPQSATAGRAGGGMLGHADPVPHPGVGSWPRSCPEGPLPPDPWGQRGQLPATSRTSPPCHLRQFGGELLHLQPGLLAVGCAGAGLPQWELF